MAMSTPSDPYGLGPSAGRRDYSPNAPYQGGIQAPAPQAPAPGEDTGAASGDPTADNSGELQAQIDQLTQQNTELQQQNDQLNTQVSQLTDQLGQAQSDAADAKQALQDEQTAHQQDVAALNQQMQQLQGQLADAQNALTQAQGNKASPEAQAAGAPSEGVQPANVGPELGPNLGPQMEAPTEQMPGQGPLFGTEGEAPEGTTEGGGAANTQVLPPPLNAEGTRGSVYDTMPDADRYKVDNDPGVKQSGSDAPPGAPAGSVSDQGNTRAPLSDLITFDVDKNGNPVVNFGPGYKNLPPEVVRGLFQMAHDTWQTGASQQAQTWKEKDALLQQAAAKELVAMQLKGQLNVATINATSTRGAEESRLQGIREQEAGATARQQVAEQGLSSRQQSAQAQQEGQFQQNFQLEQARRSGFRAPGRGSFRR